MNLGVKGVMLDLYLQAGQGGQPDRFYVNVKSFMKKEVNIKNRI